jgi:hypothetical protein
MTPAMEARHRSSMRRLGVPLLAASVWLGIAVGSIAGSAGRRPAVPDADVARDGNPSRLRAARVRRTSSDSMPGWAKRWRPRPAADRDCRGSGPRGVRGSGRGCSRERPGSGCRGNRGGGAREPRGGPDALAAGLEAKGNDTAAAAISENIARAVAHNAAVLEILANRHDATGGSAAPVGTAQEPPTAAPTTDPPATPRADGGGSGPAETPRGNGGAGGGGATTPTSGPGPGRDRAADRHPEAGRARQARQARSQPAARAPLGRRPGRTSGQPPFARSRTSAPSLAYARPDDRSAVVARARGPRRRPCLVVAARHGGRVLPDPNRRDRAPARPGPGRVPAIGGRDRAEPAPRCRDQPPPPRPLHRSRSAPPLPHVRAPAATPDAGHRAGRARRPPRRAARGARLHGGRAGRRAASRDPARDRRSPPRGEARPPTRTAATRSASRRPTAQGSSTRATAGGRGTSPR